LVPHPISVFVFQENRPINKYIHIYIRKKDRDLNLKIRIQNSNLKGPAF
jgi:hypothetical protein